jgi:catechol 2,3-dioxygenase-like lactoylglutathione lyase family enzyme
MIQHVTFEIRPDEIDACVAFYGLLGFSAVEPPPSLAQRAAWVQRGPTQIHLMRVEEPTTLPQGHVAVIAEDYEQTIERLTGAGHDVEARREHWGSPRSLVHDPAGNLVEVMAFPPPGSES